MAWTTTTSISAPGGRSSKFGDGTRRTGSGNQPPGSSGGTVMRVPCSRNMRVNLALVFDCGLCYSPRPFTATVRQAVDGALGIARRDAVYTLNTPDLSHGS